MLTNTVVANHKHAQAGIEKLTGVVADTKNAEADLQKALDRAISIGEARAKATEQRIAEHLKNTKRYLQVELIEQAEKAADNVFNILQGKRQFIADNYLSLKAYSIAAADKIQDYRESAKGVLQVDKVDGKNGNFVYINGRSVGLSNKLSDFSSLASKMSVYEAVLAKLTAKVKPAVPSKLKKLSVSPPEWQGN